jgi:hypothetical protein
MKALTIDAAGLRYKYLLQLAGTNCTVSTNSSLLGNTLSAWFATSFAPVASAFSMQVVVTPAKCTLGLPHFRGLHHLVIASFGLENVFVFDALRRTIVSTVSQEIANDRKFWSDLLLPISLGVLGAAVGVVPVHCACLSLDDGGLLITGASGAGKSTLSAALAQHGFGFLSDDWTYLSCENGNLVAHGMGVPIKLLPDTIEYFPALASYPVQLAFNGELAYEVPAKDLGARVQSLCRPRWLLFLERGSAKGCKINPVPAAEALHYLENSVERLPPELNEIARKRAAILQDISRLSCWRLRYSGHPRVAVQGVREFLCGRRKVVSA